MKLFIMNSAISLKEIVMKITRTELKKLIVEAIEAEMTNEANWDQYGDMYAQGASPEDIIRQYQKNTAEESTAEEYRKRIEEFGEELDDMSYLDPKMPQLQARIKRDISGILKNIKDRDVWEGVEDIVIELLGPKYLPVSGYGMEEGLAEAQQDASLQSEEQLKEKLKNIQNLIKTGNIGKINAAFVELKHLEAAAARSELVKDMVGDKIERLEKQRIAAVRKWEQGIGL
jgi:hypothetical protein